MPWRHTSPTMANRTNPVHDAARLADWVHLQVCREIRLARIVAGMTQRQVGITIRRSASWVSRLEAGKVKGVSVVELARVAAAVGLKLYVSTFPAIRRPLDGPQIALLGAFNRRLHRSWHRRMEVLIQRPGDHRAVDEVIHNGECTIAVEAYTRLADGERQVRAARTKQRDIGADRLILLVKASGANRRMLHEMGPMIRDEFPIGTRASMKALAAGRDPGGDCLVLI